MIRVGVVGYGYWGPNLARNFAVHDGFELAAVCDQREDKLAIARSRHPGIRTCTRIEDLLADGGIDAVAIATPVDAHFDLAGAALASGATCWSRSRWPRPPSRPSG